MALNKHKIKYDPGDANCQDTIGSYLLDANGDELTSTLVGSDQALDINIVASSGQYNEDDAHTSGDAGDFVLGIRRDADTSPVSADGDYHPFVFNDSGFLKVTSEVTVEPSDAEYAEDSAHTTADVGLHMLAVRQDTLASSVDADGDYGSLKLNSSGELYVTASFSGSGIADDAVDGENPMKVGTRSEGGPLTAVSADGDRADMISDAYRRLWVNNSPNVAQANSNNTAIGATAVNIDASPLAGRKRVILQNLGKTVYLGGSGVTTATGIEIACGDTFNEEWGEDVPIYLISADATASDVRLLEIA